MLEEEDSGRQGARQSEMDERENGPVHVDGQLARVSAMAMARAGKRAATARSQRCMLIDIHELVVLISYRFGRFWSTGHREEGDELSARLHLQLLHAGQLSPGSIEFFVVAIFRRQMREGVVMVGYF